MKAKRFLLAMSAAAATVAAARPAHAGPTLTTLASFAGTSNGATPLAGLTFDAAGNLYGTTSAGGSANDGTVFELSGTTHQTLTTVTTFTGPNGALPEAGLTVDVAGNLYGTTYVGGGTGVFGTAFELSGTTHQTLTRLAAFTLFGSNPVSTLTADAAGNLYGTTKLGGAGNAGTAFELSGTAHQTFTSLAAFNTANGANPEAGLTLYAGNLYGTTFAGGANGVGTVFELAGPTFGTITTLATFNTSDGAGPEAALSFDAAGNLYGTTYRGGFNGGGTVFELSGTNHQTLTTLASFAPPSDAGPGYGVLNAGVTVDAAGNLFGTTSAGGTYDDGTVFELSGTTHQTLTTLATFNNLNGGGPRAGLTADAAGNLYGTTTAGYGTAFELSNAGYVLPAVVVPIGGNYQFALPTTTGITVIALLGLNLSSGSTATLPFNPNLLTRQLLYIGVDGFVEKTNTSGMLALARLDLGDNDLDLSSSGPGNGINNLTTVTARVAQGYGGGTWNGSGGIVSSAAAADPTRTTAVGVIQNDQGGSPLYTAANPFDGYTPGPDDTLVKYTYYGDANLDGKVDGADYGQIDAGFLSGGALTGWFYGDFNYDGVVDASDYTLIDNGFNLQGPSLSAAVAVPTAELSAAAVPEPAAAAVVAVVAVAGLRRSRRPDRR